MSWNYRITKQRYVDPMGEEAFLFEVREVYYEDHRNGTRTVQGWTENPVSFGGDDPQDVIKSLEMALHDAKAHDVLDIGDYVPKNQSDAHRPQEQHRDHSQSAFVVELVDGQRTTELLRTDDWLEANDEVSDRPRDEQARIRIQGVHPTHSFVVAQGESLCIQCGAFENGSYGSQAPCGFDFEGRSLAWHIQRWRERRDASERGTRA